MEVRCLQANENNLDCCFAFFFRKLIINLLFNNNKHKNIIGDWYVDAARYDSDCACVGGGGKSNKPYFILFLFFGFFK